MSRRSPVALAALSLSVAIAISGSGVAHAETPRPAPATEGVAESPVRQIVVYDHGVTIDGTYYTKDEFTQLLSKAVPIQTSAPAPTSGQGMIFAAPVAAGAYFIPGIGQVLVAATGAIIVGGVTIAAGTWLFNTISRWFQNSGEAREISDARNAIPSRLKDGNGNVKVGEFNRKVRSKSDRKEPGGWSISKDKDGHKGSEWKVLNPKNKRVASIRGNGQVVGK